MNRRQVFPRINFLFDFSNHFMSLVNVIMHQQNSQEFWSISVGIKQRTYNNKIQPMSNQQNSQYNTPSQNRSSSNYYEDSSSQKRPREVPVATEPQAPQSPDSETMKKPQIIPGVLVLGGDNRFYQEEDLQRMAAYDRSQALRKRSERQKKEAALKSIRQKHDQERKRLEQQKRWRQENPLMENEQLKQKKQSKQKLETSKNYITEHKPQSKQMRKTPYYSMDADQHKPVSVRHVQNRVPQKSEKQLQEEKQIRILKAYEEQKKIRLIQEARLRRQRQNRYMPHPSQMSRGGQGIAPNQYQPSQVPSQQSQNPSLGNQRPREPQRIPSVMPLTVSRFGTVAQRPYGQFNSSQGPSQQSRNLSQQNQQPRQREQQRLKSERDARMIRELSNEEERRRNQYRASQVPSQPSQNPSQRNQRSREQPSNTQEQPRIREYYLAGHPPRGPYSIYQNRQQFQNNVQQNQQSREPQRNTQEVQPRIRRFDILEQLLLNQNRSYQNNLRHSQNSNLQPQQAVSQDLWQSERQQQRIQRNQRIQRAQKQKAEKQQKRKEQDKRRKQKFSTWYGEDQFNSVDSIQQQRLLDQFRKYEQEKEQQEKQIKQRLERIEKQQQQVQNDKKALEKKLKQRVQTFQRQKRYMQINRAKKQEDQRLIKEYYQQEKRQKQQQLAKKSKNREQTPMQRYQSRLNSQSSSQSSSNESNNYQPLSLSSSQYTSNHLGPIRQQEFDESQRRITEYVGDNPRSNRANANRNDQQNQQRASIRENRDQQTDQDSAYKIVIKQSIEKPRCDPDYFNKDNDIYGFDSRRDNENWMEQSSQNQRNIENYQFDMSDPFRRERQREFQHRQTTSRIIQVKPPFPYNQRQNVQYDLGGPYQNEKFERQRNIYYFPQTNQDIEMRSPVASQNGQDIEMRTPPQAQNEYRQNGNEDIEMKSPPQSVEQRFNVENHPPSPQFRSESYPNQALNQPHTNDISRVSSYGSNIANRGHDLMQLFQQKRNAHGLIQNTAQTQSQARRFITGQVEDNRKNQTDIKKQQSRNVKFYYSKTGDEIFTEQCLKDPLNDYNRIARITPASKALGRPQKMQLQNVASHFYGKQLPTQSQYFPVQISSKKLESQQKEQKKLLQYRINQPLSGVKTIYYRTQEQLDKILDYIDIEEKLSYLNEKIVSIAYHKEEIKMQSSRKDEEKQEAPKRDQKQEFSESNMRWRNDGVIRHHRMPQLLPHNIEEEQIELSMIDQFVPKPHPVFTHPAYIGLNLSEQEKSKWSSIKSKQKVTRAKPGKTPARLDEYLKKCRQEQKEKEASIVKQPTGSTFHYELVPLSRGNSSKKLVQVRRSGRLFSKSKAHENEQLESVEEKPQLQGNNSRKQSSKSKSKYKSQRASQAASKSKNPPSRSAQKPNHGEQITIEWLKDHISQLNQIFVGNVFMEDEYNAMTQKDAEIQKFLYELERSKQEEKNEEKSHPQVKQVPQVRKFVRENEIMRRVKDSPQNKKASKQPSKQSKFKSKSTKGKNNHSLSREALSKQAKIKLQRTMQISLKPQNKKLQQNHQQQQFQENQQHQQQQKIEQQQAEVKLEHQTEVQNNIESNRNMTKQDKIRLFNENKQKYRVNDNFPLLIQSVVDPDILGLGIYALVKLARFSQFQAGTPYAITPLCEIRFARKKDVKAVVEESKNIVPKEYAENIALIALNSNLLNLIHKAKNEKKSNSENEHENGENCNDNDKQSINENDSNNVNKANESNNASNANNSNNQSKQQKPKSSSNQDVDI